MTLKKSKKMAAPILHSKTLEIHGGGSLRDIEIRPGLARVIAFSLGSFDRGQRLFEGREEGFIYTRINNPTVDKLERRLAAMEGAEAGLATSSGMSAINLIALHLANKGGHIVTSNRLYGGVFHLFRERMPALDIPVTFVENPHDIKQWEGAILPETRFLYVESPSNPLLDVFDIEAIAQVAHRHKLPLVVDSTLATPVLLQPLSHGADFVVHSLSKYMGDGEVIGGMILGKKHDIDAVRLDWFRDTGPCISPDNASVLCYHLESLYARMHEHCGNASEVAAFLSKHPKVKQVHYPTIGTEASKNKKLMKEGFGGLMAFDVRGGRREAKVVLEHLRIFWHAANIGEARSLVIHPATTTHGQMTPAELAAAGISQSTIRLSVGREDPQDLIDDLTQALAKI